MAHNNYKWTFLLGFLIITMTSNCKSQYREECTYVKFINSSLSAATPDTLCEKLGDLQNKGFSLFFYISDSLPSGGEVMRLNTMLLKQEHKGAIIFIGLNKEFYISYSKKLKEEPYLQFRYQLTKAVKDYIHIDRHNIFRNLSHVVSFVSNAMDQDLPIYAARNFGDKNSLN